MITCRRCNHWLQPALDESDCPVCEQLHRVISLLVGGSIPLRKQQVVQTQLDCFASSLEAIVSDSTDSSWADRWVDRRPIRRSPGTERSEPATSAHLTPREGRSSSVASGTRPPSVQGGPAPYRRLDLNKLPAGSVGAQLAPAPKAGWTPSLRAHKETPKSPLEKPRQADKGRDRKSPTPFSLSPEREKAGEIGVSLSASDSSSDSEGSFEAAASPKVDAKAREEQRTVLASTAPKRKAEGESRRRHSPGKESRREANRRSPEPDKSSRHHRRQGRSGSPRRSSRRPVSPGKEEPQKKNEWKRKKKNKGRKHAQRQLEYKAARDARGHEEARRPGRQD